MSTLPSTLPSLENIRDTSSNPESPLARALSILFESSPTLTLTLEPQLSNILKSQPPLDSYRALVEIALEEITKWNITAQSDFISGHPRIGENKKISDLSAKEQGITAAPTPPEVLARLLHLNACYEAKYPGLRYITFVNGRSRAEIAQEIEGVLGLDSSLSPDTPKLEDIDPASTSTDCWKSELRRAIRDIGLIAKSRLKILGVE